MKSLFRCEFARSRRAKSPPAPGCRAAWCASTRARRSVAATSRSPPFRRYSVIPVPRKLCAQISAGSPACRARRLIIRSAVARDIALVLQPVLPSRLHNTETTVPFRSSPRAPPPRDTHPRIPAPGDAPAPRCTGPPSRADGRKTAFPACNSPQPASIPPR